MELVTPDLGLVVWTTLSFLIVLFVLGKFAVTPIAEALKERDQHIEGMLSAAETAKSELTNLQLANDKLIKEAREERDLILKEARAQASKLVSDAQESAKAESNKIIVSAQEAIQNEKKQAMAEVRNQMASVSVQIAEKVIRRELSNKDNQVAYVNELLNDIKLN